MSTSELITVFVSLLVIIDPVALAPLFIALTKGQSARRRRIVGLRACVVAFGLLTVFGLAGDELLAFLGISMPAFRIAGGLLLFLTALDMLFERRTQRRQGQADEADEHDDPSVFPLAIPLLAGPGAIATMILLAGADGIAATDVLAIHLVMFVVLVLVFISFLLAPTMERLLGPVGINVVTRILGMLLAALSVQFVIDGILQMQVI
ncbi:MarC family protein [Alterinioella nitratireducens]|jgi:multiple antibiotic resistance protein|uniref:MarC family protein n=1 Tax=Alterinioella nitratireducens TaxID=2735915 RepID=UPI000C6B57D4|nr:MarC family protein [Alterinioella nitratireducens]MAX73950.1 MarC family transcriptional regulator [Nioella sp.]NPD20818.1 MarC family protein [Alterinioella nitratireducens]|tara:strand:- start:636 stop:1256 length:621 start_codon:yes stop_codon:yes gene_type:complete